jgi:thiamine-monophosphate kinase
LGGCDIIGHITSADTGCYLTTPEGNDIKITSPGFPEGL